jgi:hypothetical protein
LWWQPLLCHSSDVAHAVAIAAAAAADIRWKAPEERKEKNQGILFISRLYNIGYYRWQLQHDTANRREEEETSTETEKERGEEGEQARKGA